jgi:hypothetical protein
MLGRLGNLTPEQEHDLEFYYQQIGAGPMLKERQISDWKKILLAIPDRSTYDVAERILTVLVGYPTSFTKEYQRHAKNDTTQLARALEAFVDLRVYEIEGRRNERCELCGVMTLPEELRENSEAACGTMEST